MPPLRGAAVVAEEAPGELVLAAVGLWLPAVGLWLPAAAALAVRRARKAAGAGACMALSAFCT
ncbi:MAG: hypothetical protein M3Z27_09535, partial [Actinomycetota bacterium]|nr:hypothetical protein [Actinomycetota bacterium]